MSSNTSNNDDDSNNNNGGGVDADGAVQSGGRRNANAVDPRIKELKSAVSDIVNDNKNPPQHIRGRVWGSLRHVVVSSQNSPVDRFFLDTKCLAPSSFVVATMAFLPREALEKDANIYLHRNRAHDPTGKFGRLYSYAMLLFYNAYRRGNRAASWKGTHNGNAVSVFKAPASVMVVQTVYSRTGTDTVKGWYFYCYENIEPKPDTTSSSSAPARGGRRPREESFATLFDKAVAAYTRKGPREMDRVLNAAPAELAGRVRERIHQETGVRRLLGRIALYCIPLISHCTG